MASREFSFRPGARLGRRQQPQRLPKAPNDWAFRHAAAGAPNTAALLADLKQRGLFENTLVVWGGEFGRLPIAQLPDDKNEQNAGRDHNKNAFTTWMAGAGIKGGPVFGATDELGLCAVEGWISVADWHATILHRLGLD